MAESTITYTNRNGTLSFEDGDSPVNTYTVAFEAGDLSFDVPQESLVAILDRGQFGATPQVRKVEDQPITGTFTADLRDLTDATEETLVDIAHWAGWTGSNWVPTNGASADKPLVTMKYTLSTTGGAEAATITFAFVALTLSITEAGEGSTISISFTSYAVLPTIS